MRLGLWGHLPFDMYFDFRHSADNPLVFQIIGTQ
ncbi:Uncharacterised protein [Mycobacteroides abscessus subsp. abscessus]|nr:Uncharacterised protein [Mycobacteroides abscessus subsp. abscessus]